MKIQTILLAVTSLVVFLFNPSWVRQGYCKGEKMAIITFFYLVNVSGQEIRVKVTANGNEPFTREVRSRRKPSSDIKEAPPPRQIPSRRTEGHAGPKYRDPYSTGDELWN